MRNFSNKACEREKNSRPYINTRNCRGEEKNEHRKIRKRDRTDSQRIKKKKPLSQARHKSFFLRRAAYTELW